MADSSRLKEMLSTTTGKMKVREQRVSEYLLENEDRIQTLSISEIARESGASKATVVRFCKTLGFQGLKDFRVWYEAGKGIGFVSVSKIEEDAVPEEKILALRTGLSKTVGATLNEELTSSLIEVLAEVETASSIAIVGEGENAPFAEILGAVLSNAYPEKTLVLTTKEKMDATSSASICLVISFSGSDKASMGYMSSVILDGGKAVAFSAESGSLIGRSSNSTILLSNEEIFDGDAYILAKSSLLSIFSCLRVLLRKA